MSRIRRRTRNLWWLAVIPVIFIAAYIGREQLAPQGEPGVPDTGVASTTSSQTDSVTSVATSVSQGTSVQDASSAANSGPSISFLPSTVIQGDPVEILVNGASASEVKSITYNGTALDVFSDNGKPAAVVGIALKARSGSYPVVATLANGQTIKKTLVVGTRQVATAPLGIPASLGGNTEAAAQNLVTNLSQDNAILNAVPSADAQLWQGAFQYPVADPVVTDTYGYTRSTVDTTISHEGTDFRAPPGTPVYAMNAGVVKLARSFTSYGNTIVIDHGDGIETLYLHLSEIDVQVGQSVTKGELIGKSGETGYAEGPHLHLSVKINHISIDPQEFLKIF